VIESIEEYVQNNRTESPFWPTAINR
jgi:hypothetical protein